MIDSQDDIEIRKVQALTGERSFTLVFPKQFAMELGVGNGGLLKMSGLWQKISGGKGGTLV